MVKAYIRPERIDFVKKALEDHAFYAMSISEAMGRGDQKGISLQYRGGTMAIDLLPKTRIEVVTRDADADKVVQIIASAAKTGKIGDGKIFVLPVERSVRVRTGEVEV